MNKEKGILFGFLYILAIVVAARLIIIGTNVIPGMVIIGLSLLVLYLYAIPEFYKKYYTLADASEYCNFTRFIPVYNQIMLFTPLIAKLFLTSVILTIVSWGLVFVQPANLKFLPSSIAMNWANGWIVIGILLILTTAIIQGLGYVELVREIERDIKDISGISRDRAADAIFVFVQYLLLFIPVFRVISIILQIGSLNKLVVFSGVTNAKLDQLLQGNLETDDYEYDDYGDDEDYEDYEDYDDDDDDYDDKPNPSRRWKRS